MTIILEGVSYSINGVRILDEVYAEFREGVSYAIVGKSGSGKTTLLRLIAGIVKPSSGSIRFTRRHRVAYVPQSLGLISGATALENTLIAFSSRCRICAVLSYWPRRYVEEALSALRLVGLEDKAHTVVDRLSGGEAQRVAIARAIAYGADVLLADEPISNLDEETAESIIRLLVGLKSLGNIVVVVLHDSRLVKYFDVVYVMSGGRLTIQRANS